MRFIIYLLSLSFSFCISSASLSADDKDPVEGVRVWTNSKKQDLTASLVKIVYVKPAKKEDKPRYDVTFKLKTGKKVTFDLELLSKPHKDELWAWLKGNPYGVAKPTPPYTWPTQHNGNNSPKVEYVKYDEERYAHLYKTAHFDFYSDERLTNSTISKCVALFDSIVGAIDSLPLELDTIPSGDKPRYQAILLSTREKYMQMGGIHNSGGFFSSGENLTVIPFESLGIEKKGNNWIFDGKNRSFSTLVHELTHHSTSHWLHTPAWFYEGLAEYMAAMPYQSGRFLFTNPGSSLSSDVRSKYKNTVIEDAVFPKGVFQMKHPEQLLTITYEGWGGDLKKNLTNGSRNYTSSMILAYFFMHEDGNGDGHNLIQWLHEHRAAAASRKDSELDAIFKKHILRDRTYKQLEEEIKTAMGKKGLRLEFAP